MAPVWLAALLSTLLILLASSARADVIANAPGQPTLVVPSAEADFGTSLMNQGLSGEFVMLSAAEVDACAPLTETVPKNASMIALVRRGGVTPDNRPCLFDFKVFNAQNAGFRAVIVFDNVPEDGLITMGSDSDLVIGIPSVFISLESAILLINTAMATNGSLTVVLTPDDSDVHWPSFLVIFIVSIAASLCIFTVFIVCRQRLRIQQRAEARFTAQEIIKLPTRPFDAAQDSEGSCCICLDEYDATCKKITTLPCKHKFHHECIEPWLQRRRICPMCKRDPVLTESSPLLVQSA